MHIDEQHLHVGFHHHINRHIENCFKVTSVYKQCPTVSQSKTSAGITWHHQSHPAGLQKVLVQVLFSCAVYKRIVTSLVCKFYFHPIFVHSEKSVKHFFWNCYNFRKCDWLIRWQRISHWLLYTLALKNITRNLHLLSFTSFLSL